MKQWSGGTECPDGVYFNTKQWEFVNVHHGKPAVLPGSKDTRYYRIWAILQLVAGPVFGVMFVIFLPLFGILSTIGYSVYRIRHKPISAKKPQTEPVPAGAMNGEGGRQHVD